jgi:hypothetical protein
LNPHANCKFASLIQPVSYYRELQDSWFFNRLRWCPECIQVGQHSLLHQFKLIKRCPVHETILFDSCPNCLKTIPFFFSGFGLSEPFTCKYGHRLANFSESLWKNWVSPMEIQDQTVLKWLTMDQNANQRWLFSHNYASTDLFQTVPLIFSKRFYGIRMNTKAEYYRTVSYRDDNYHQNRVCF